MSLKLVKEIVFSATALSAQALARYRSFFPSCFPHLHAVLPFALRPYGSAAGMDNPMRIQPYASNAEVGIKTYYHWRRGEADVGICVGGAPSVGASPL